MDGIRLGFIPIAPLCVQGGLHHIQLSTLSRPQKPSQSASRLFWLPSEGAWLLDLSSISLSDTAPPDRPDLAEQAGSEASVGQRLTRLDEGASLPPSSALKLEMKNRFLHYQTQSGPPSQAFLSAHDVRLTLPSTLSSSLMGDVDFQSTQDLRGGDLPLHRMTLWHENEALLSLREGWLGYRLASNASMTWILSAGRQRLNIQPRKLTTDALKIIEQSALGPWMISSSLSGGLSADHQAWEEGESPKSAEQIFRIGFESLAHCKSCLLTPQLRIVALGEGRQFRDQLLHGELELATGLQPLELSPSEAGGAVKTSLTLDQSREDTRSDQTTSFSVGAWTLSTNFSSGSMLIFPIQIEGELQYRNGKRWDLLMSPGERWPSGVSAPTKITQGSFTLSQFSMEYAQREGARALWGGSDPARGRSRRIQLGWQSSTPAEPESAWGCEVKVKRWSADEGARRWGVSPWATRDHQGPRSIFTTELKGRFQTAIKGTLSMNISAQYERGFAPHRLNWYWLTLGLVGEGIDLALRCGKPSEIGDLLAPNLWLTECGLQFTLLSDITL